MNRKASAHQCVAACIAGLAALFFAALPMYGADTESQPPVYRVLRTHSSVEFTILKWNVFRELGRFTRFQGTLRYDPAEVVAASVEFTVEADSIDTGMALRDSILRSEDFFDVEAHRLLEFRSTSVRRIDPRSLSVSGDLTIRGVTRQITIPVTVIGADERPQIGRVAGFEAAFAIDRTDFGIDGARWSGGRDSLSRQVQVHVRIGSVEPPG